MARRNRARSARQQRFRLRPLLLRAGSGQDRGRAAARGKESSQPSRPGIAEAPRNAAGIMSAVLQDMRRVRFAALPPLSLYVHLPWCVRKCPYCDFNSHERSGELPEAEYLAALTRDIEGMLPSVWGRRIRSIFIGGGTPSLFSAKAIDGLLAGIRSRLQIEPDAEITLEANPGTVEATRFRGYRDAGVNRLSLGVQSFDDAMLKALGR